MAASPRNPNLAARMGAWSAAHRRTAVLGWIAFVVVALVIGSAAGTKSIPDEDQGNGESRAAEQAIAAADFRDSAGEQVLVQARNGRTTGDPAFQATIRDVARTLEQRRYVFNVASPLADGNEGQVSADRRSALVTYELADDDDAAEDRIGAVLTQLDKVAARHAGFRVESFGDASAAKAIGDTLDKDFQRAEFLSLPITLVILIVAFGALVAAGIPLLLALSAVAAAMGLVGPASQLVPMDDAAGSVLLLIGLAVGVDYSLFYMRRAREERERGASKDAAVRAAAATAGHAVLISGATVIVAMAGMYLGGNAIFASMATATILVVAIAVLGSVTVLPALLSKLGANVERGRVPLLGHRKGRAGVWAAILRPALKHPVAATVVSAGLLVALATPALHLDLVNPGVQGIPRDLPVMQTYDRIQAAFPGGPLPAQVAVSADDVTAPAVTGGIARLERAALRSGEMRGPIDVRTSPDKSVAVVSIPLAGDGSDATSEHALQTLRTHVIPATISAVDGVKAQVAGYTAGSKDFDDQMARALPVVMAFVLGLAFLLLLFTFRSIVVPIKAIVLNLLSVGAAYGVLVWGFQDGHLEGLLGFQSVGGVTAWLPLFLFVVLFGLSMDYHVLILSRIREAVDGGMRTRAAVGHGITSTAGVVTSAAIVMVAVFSVFATLSTVEFKMMGVGLAVAVLLDATIVRAVLLPAAMTLLGEANWYLPHALRRRMAPRPAAAAAG